MAFKNWIIKTGVAQVAKRLKVSPSTVYRWLNGERVPSDRKKKKIVEITQGTKTPVTYKDLFN